MRLSDVQVVTTEGPGSGTTVTTDATGKYRLELPAGPFRLRWSKTGYVARESDPAMVNSGATTTVPDVMLDGREWTIAGVVTDGLGRPVPGIRVGVSSTYLLASSTSDIAGRYTMTSNFVVPPLTSIRASKEGYKEAQVPFACCAEDTERVTIDLRIVRILRVALTAPTVLRVGQWAALGFEAEFEDGTRERGAAGSPVSSDSTVVRVGERTNDGIVSYPVVEGLARGTATITGSYYRAGVAVVPLQIRVVD
jgi:hypothetical protein